MNHTNTNTKHTLKKEDLDSFTGSEHLFRHWLRRDLFYTDGVQHVAEKGGAYWLIDLIVSEQTRWGSKREEFQVWTLKTANESGTLTAEDGNGKELYRLELAYTDFPLSEIKLYFTDSVLLLPSEY